MWFFKEVGIVEYDQYPDEYDMKKHDCQMDKNKTTWKITDVVKNLN